MIIINNNKIILNNKQLNLQHNKMIMIYKINILIKFLVITMFQIKIHANKKIYFKICLIHQNNKLLKMYNKIYNNFNKRIKTQLNKIIRITILRKLILITLNTLKKEIFLF